MTKQQPGPRRVGSSQIDARRPRRRLHLNDSHLRDADSLDRCDPRSIRPGRAQLLAVSVARVGKELELRRHSDADEDVLTDAGVAAALAIGAHLRGGYQLAVSSGAQ